MINLAVYGPVTHIARSLSGEGLPKALTVRELAEGYEHHPPTDFGRIRDTAMEECRRSYPDVNWPSKVYRRTWNDETCTEFLVLVTLNAMQRAGLASSDEDRWSLTDKAMSIQANGGSLLQAISGNVFSYTEEEMPEPEPKPLQDRPYHSAGPPKTNPNKETWSVSYTKEAKTLRRSWATLEFEGTLRKVAEALGCDGKQDFLDRAIEHYLGSVLQGRVVGATQVSGEIKDEILETLRRVAKTRQVLGEKK